jgi:MFS transporter, AAHS family, 4-hydroxybenzoate transporter
MEHQTPPPTGVSDWTTGVALSIAHAPLVYPPSIRSTGVGWALGIGRLGAILGPLIGGVLIGLKWTSRDLFLAAAVPAAIAATSATALSVLLRRSQHRLASAE